MGSHPRYRDFVEDALGRIRQVDPTQLEVARTGQRDDGTRFHILDVREPGEIEGGSIPGATMLPRGLVEKHVLDHIPDQAESVCVVCESGSRSALVVDVLQRMGYGRASSLRGGMQAWRGAALPLETSEAASLPWRADGPVHSCVQAGQLSWEEIRAQYPIVGRKVPVMGEGQMALAYLDHAASTHPPACVLERYAEFMSGEYANIHRGVHLLSRRATQVFDDCYGVVAEFIGADLGHGSITFLTNATQAIDLCAHAMEHVPGKVIVSELEHHSNDLPHRRRGPVLRARVHEDGSLDLDHLEQLLRNNSVKLVALSGGSNVTGWMPPVHRVARMAHEHGARILVDGAQLLAHHPIDVRGHDDPEHLDFLAAAGHKAYAPFGSGFLHGPRSVLDDAPPYLPGGGTATRVTAETADFVPSPDRHQGGTPNIGGVIAMAEALGFLGRIGMSRVREHELELTIAALEGLRAMDGVTIYGPTDPSARLGVIAFNVAGVSDMLAAAVLSEERGIACRNGRFCAHIYMDRLLETQGGATVERGANPGAVRASFGLYNGREDVDRLIEGVGMLCNRDWRGEYRVRGDEYSAEFSGRCNDLWMEAAKD